MTPAEQQEGIIMFCLLVGMVVAWGIWFIRFVRKWEREEQAWRQYKHQMTELERKRIKARNYRYSEH